MPIVLSVALAIAFLASSVAPSQRDLAPPGAIEGRLLDCMEGKTIEIGHIDVYAYELPAASKLYEDLQRLDELRGRAKDGAATEFFSSYNRVEKLVASGQFPGSHTLSDTHGKFIFEHLSTSKEYLILAIGLNVEDEPAYYNFMKISLSSKHGQIIIWMEPSERRKCDHGRMTHP
jgi:hypothetical protein